jgi:hypothetical protein
MRMLIITAALMLLIGGTVWLTWSEGPELPPAAVDAEGAAAGQQPRTDAGAGQPDDRPSESFTGQSFRQQLRAFVETAAGLPEAQRNAQAEALHRETLAREADGSLLPAESAYLQLALLKVSVTDEGELRRRSRALLDSYAAASESGWERYRQQTDSRHEAYRQAEAELIRRAQQRGDSAEDLRAQLQALREQHYGDQPPLQ